MMTLQRLSSTLIGRLLVLLLCIAPEVLASQPPTASSLEQCSNKPPGLLGRAGTQACPLPGHLGIIPEIESTAVSWDFPPRCVESLGKSASNSRVDCLFTSASFRNGQGISLITSTATAAHLVGLDAFADLPDPLPATTRRRLAGPAYAVVDVPGKGKGVVATRRIRRGEIVMVDYPALLVGMAFLTDNKPHHRRRLIKQAINQLPESTQRKVHALSRGTAAHEVDAILGPNANTVTLGEDEVHVGLFAEAAVRLPFASRIR